MKSLTRKQRRALKDFSELKISLEDLREDLRAVLEFHFTSDERELTSHFGTPEPGIKIGLGHIRNATDKHARGEITTEELSDWAAMLQLNDAYTWEGPEEEQVADWLNEISLLALKPKRQTE